MGSAGDHSARGSQGAPAQPGRGGPRAQRPLFSDSKSPGRGQRDRPVPPRPMHLTQEQRAAVEERLGLLSRVEGSDGRLHDAGGRPWYDFETTPSILEGRPSSWDYVPIAEVSALMGNLSLADWLEDCLAMRAEGLAAQAKVLSTCRHCHLLYNRVCRCVLAAVPGPGTSSGGGSLRRISGQTSYPVGLAE